MRVIIGIQTVIVLVLAITVVRLSQNHPNMSDCNKIVTAELAMSPNLSSYATVACLGLQQQGAIK